MIAEPAQPDLTRNQSLVYARLSAASGPLSAYAILDQLRDDGLRAPLQVYRALDKLVAAGMVHRLESLNSFVACRRDDCQQSVTLAFMICDICGTVSELADERLAGDIRSLADRARFAPDRITIELHGRCHRCRSG